MLRRFAENQVLKQEEEKEHTGFPQGWVVNSFERREMEQISQNSILNASCISLRCLLWSRQRKLIKMVLKENQNAEKWSRNAHRKCACVRACVQIRKGDEAAKAKGEHMEDMRAHSGDFKQTD